MHLFTLEVGDNLQCLTTGKSVPQEIRNDLLMCFETGQKWCEEFFESCFNDPARFERAIKRKTRGCESLNLDKKRSISQMMPFASTQDYCLLVWHKL